jgi:hypothetical protein
MSNRIVRSRRTYPSTEENTDRSVKNTISGKDTHSMAIEEYRRNRTRLGNHASLILGNGSTMGTLGILDMSRPNELLPAKLSEPGLNGLWRGEARPLPYNNY